MDWKLILGCPRCGAEMEEIDSAIDLIRLDQLRLCPECYLVTWNDLTGLHTRQGVPMSGDCAGATKLEIM